MADHFRVLSFRAKQNCPLDGQFYGVEKPVAGLPVEQQALHRWEKNYFPCPATYSSGSGWNLGLPTRANLSVEEPVLRQDQSSGEVMSLRNRVVLPIVALLSLTFLVACGSGTHSPVPPPSGGFSNTDFNGTYTFSILGLDANGTFAMAGSLTACGCTAGTIS